jgi:hypothetical protein
MKFSRSWGGDEWQAYALKLVQLRHGAENVQVVPDKVQGDAGIEFFSLDGCLYQCFAPEETADVAKAANAMKAKASRDLNKLGRNAVTIQNLLQKLQCSRWILLSPFLDNKDVVVSVRAHGQKIRALGLSFLTTGFEALVQSQDDFATEIEKLRLEGAALAVAYEKPQQSKLLTKLPAKPCSLWPTSSKELSRWRQRINGIVEK